MKQKRKAQPINLTRYWIGFSLLAIFLLIPFRIVGYWQATQVIYILIAMSINLVALRFVLRFGWKRWIVLLMIVCLCIPIVQVWQTPNYSSCLIEQDREYPLVYTTVCYDSCMAVDTLAIRDTRLIIQLEPVFVQRNTMYVCNLF